MKKEMKKLLDSIKFNNPGIDSSILAAFEFCDRKYFIETGTYSDEPQHILHGQTISQPSTIARMLFMMKLEPKLNVLEVGTNTGYHAALTSYLVWPGNVTTIEIFPDLARLAKKNIIKLKNSSKKLKLNINVLAGNALEKKTKVWKQKYDRIYFTAGVEQEQFKKVHEMAQELLNEEGLILYPTRENYDYGALELWEFKNKQLKLLHREEGYAFVPLLEDVKKK